MPILPLWYKGRVEQLWQRPYNLQSLQHSLFDPLQKRFADPYLNALELPWQCLKERRWAGAARNLGLPPLIFEEHLGFCFICWIVNYGFGKGFCLPCIPPYLLHKMLNTTHFIDCENWVSEREGAWPKTTQLLSNWEKNPHISIPS